MIHAASGEIEYAKSVIRELQALNLPYQILVTYSSPSFRKLFPKNQDIPDCPLPFDFRWLMIRFLKRYQVRMILVSRSDLWPNLAVSAHHLKIPIYYFSVTQGKSASELSFVKRSFLRNLFPLISKIFVVSHEDQMHLKASAPDLMNLEVLGDTRFDQAYFRIQNPKPLPDPIKVLTPNGLTLTLGSTWEEDEKYWLKALVDILKTDIKLIFIAPHEPVESHLLKIEKQLDSLNLKHQRLSAIRESTNSPPIILIDQMGILAEIYLKSDLVFVGGSFKGKVHSVMEPLIVGLPICVGPFYLNNREAIDFSEKKLPDLDFSPVTIVNSTETILKWVQTVSIHYQGHDLKELIKKEVLPFTGASRRLAHFIKDSLEAL
jgi:3-deoxy-D-manno-octulosonic-acid transferase